MIKIADIQHASANVRARARQTWIKKITPTQFRVVPKSASKSKRIVVFLPTNQVLCVDATTGEECPANQFETVCYHALKAATHLARQDGRKRQRKAA